MTNLPTRNQNPGDLKDPSTGTFRKFNSPQEGFTALKNDLSAKASGNTRTGLGPNSSLKELAYVWAPPSDNNNSEQYAHTLAQKLGTTTDAPLASLNIDHLASAIADAEGYQGSHPTRLSQTDFAAKIKAKYPQYANLDDTTLTQKILAKYPQYANSVDTTGLSVADSNGYVTSVPVSNDGAKPQEPGLLSQLGGRGNDIATAIGTGGQGISELLSGDLGRGAFDVGSGILQTAGAGAGGIGDVIGAGLGLIPGVKQAEETIGKGVGAVAQTELGQKALQKAQDFATKNPVLAKDIGSIGNIAALFAGGVGGKLGKEAVGQGLKSAATEGLLGAGAKGLVEKKAVADAAKILESSATKTEVKNAVRYGRASVEGGVPGIAADKLKQDSINEVASLVKKGKVSAKGLATDNANAIKLEADTTAQDMRNLIANRDVQSIVQPEDILSLEKNTIKRAGVSATPGENPAKTLLRVFKEKLPTDRLPTAEDVLNARQAVSEFVLENKGDWNMRGVLTGFKSARNAFWDESRDLLKRMAPDVPVEEMLAKQSNLYRALDYIVPNVKSELGSTPFGRFSARHPLITGTAKGALKAGVTGVAAGLGIKGAENLVP